MASRGESFFDAALTGVGSFLSHRSYVSRLVYETFATRVESGTALDGVSRPTHAEHPARRHGLAASDAVVCHRCSSTSRSLGPHSHLFVCPGCGWLAEVNGVWEPLAPVEATGHYVVNPSPLAGLREPAKVWVAPTRHHDWVSPVGARYS